MAASQKLYAWAVPIIVPGSPWDHTWVTTYDKQSPSLSGHRGRHACQARLLVLLGRLPRAGRDAEPSRRLAWIAERRHQTCALSGGSKRRLLCQLCGSRDDIYLWR